MNERWAVKGKYFVGDRRLNHLMCQLRQLVAARQAESVSDAQLLETFVKKGDESAFAAVMERHGGMVLGVCRRVLGHEQDAEDACQAVFLVLARKAAVVGKRHALASWLHGVANRVARKLKATLARQYTRDHRREKYRRSESGQEVTWRETQTILDEELSRLPESYRAQLILCYLEGKTQEEAARHLGWGQGILRGRLDRGRAQLRKSLVRRGVTVSAALVPIALSQSGMAAAAPATLVVSTARIASLLAVSWFSPIWRNRSVELAGTG